MHAYMTRSHQAGQANRQTFTLARQIVAVCLQMTLANVLHAYESILKLHGIDKGHDTFFYRFLLRLALHPAASWWDRFQEECNINEQ